MKLLGGIMILLGSSGIGICYKQQLAGRILAIQELIEILTALESEIQYHRETLPESCQRIKHSVSISMKEALLKVEERMAEKEGESFAFIFRQETEGVLKRMPLCRDDREEFYHFLPQVGFADVQMQINLIHQSKDWLEKKEKKLSTEKEKKSNLAIGLGVMSGLMILLILV